MASSDAVSSGKHSDGCCSETWPAVMLLAQVSMPGGCYGAAMASSDAVSCGKHL